TNSQTQTADSAPATSTGPIEQPNAPSLPSVAKTDVASTPLIASSANSNSDAKQSPADDAQSTPTTAQSDIADAPTSIKLVAATNEAQSPASVSSGGLHVWDTTVAALPAGSEQGLVKRGATWTHVEPAQISTHQFRGGCAIENEKL